MVDVICLLIVKMDSFCMIILDYFLFNVVKLMYVGYICSIVIGDVLYCFFCFFGYCVISDNYIGDWGT